MNDRIGIRLLVDLAHFPLDVNISSNAMGLGIFGASGAGKTSILESLAGWRTPRAGRCVIGGAVLFDTDARVNVAVQDRGVGYVPQDALLFPHMSVLDNISAGTRGRSAEGPQAVTLPHVADVLGIEHLLSRRVTQLSGGERQRVALARALLSQPRLLLLDEPLGSLDAPLRRRILPFLIRARREFAIPTIFVSHDATEVQALCEEVVVLEKGHVTHHGPAAQVLREVSQVGSAFQNVLTAIALGARGDATPAALGEGTEVMLPATGAKKGERVVFAIGADDILIAVDAPSRISARNILGARVAAIGAAHDGEVRIDLEVAPGERQHVSVNLTTQAVQDLDLHEGDAVHAIFKTTACTILSVLPDAGS